MKKIFLMSLIFSFCFVLYAQDKKQFKFDYTIKSEAFGDERKITVYLPPSYYDYPEDKFTVTYLLDGHFDPFVDLGVKIIEYNTYMYKYTPTIVVGIHAKERGWEFSMPEAEDEDNDEYQGGRAPELMQHFKNEIFPLVESHYQNVLPFRTIIGHSSGGEFVLNTLFLGDKDLFDAYIAISPGVRPGEYQAIDEAAKKLQAGEEFNKFLYCSTGSVSDRERLFRIAVNKLDSIIAQHTNHGLIWRKPIFEGTDHFTVVPSSFNDAMLELTRAFRVDEKRFNDFANDNSKSMMEHIDGFYKSRKEQYGFVEIPVPGYIKQVAWDISEQGNTKAALEIYNWAIKKHPGNFTLRKSKGKLLLKMKDNKAALNTFKDCLQVLEEIKEKIGEEAYSGQKEYINKKIKEASE